MKMVVTFTQPIEDVRVQETIKVIERLVEKTASAIGSDAEGHATVTFDNIEIGYCEFVLSIFGLRSGCKSLLFKANRERLLTLGSPEHMALIERVGEIPL